MNNDLISREALKDEVRKHAEYYADRTEEDRYNVGYTECACEILDFIDNAPTVEPENLIKPIAEIKCEISEEEKQRLIELLRKEKPKLVKLVPERPQGEWVYHTDGYTSFYTCNKCNAYGDIQDKFCKHCGADMRGGAE